MSMGKQRKADKTIRPLTTLTNLTPATVTGGVAINALGRLPIGVYKGAAAFWDLDKAVNQPLVLSEQKHIMGILDGREEDYDLQTLSLPAGVAGSSVNGSLTVPAGEVWYISTVRLIHASLGAACTGGLNWFCSMWTDRQGTLGYGQPFYGAHQISGINSNQQQDGDFWTDAPWVGIGNKDVLLRAPAGTEFTAVFDVVAGPSLVAVACTMQIFGFIGKPLVA